LWCKDRASNTNSENSGKEEKDGIDIKSEMVVKAEEESDLSEGDEENGDYVDKVDGDGNVASDSDGDVDDVDDNEQMNEVIDLT